MKIARTPLMAVSAMFLLNGGLFGAWASRVPTFKSEFSLSANQLGLLLLLLAAGAIVSFPLAGRAANNYGAAPATRILAMLHSTGLVALAISPNVYVIGIALFVFGAAHGAMDVTMNGWASEVESREGRSIMSVFHAIWSVGAGLGAVFGSAMLFLGQSVTVHFVVFAVLITAPTIWCALIEWHSKREDHSKRLGQKEKKPLFAFPTGVLLFVGLFAFCGAMTEGAMADWSAVYLVERLNAEPGNAALGFAVFSTMMVVTRLSGGKLIDHFGLLKAARFSGLFASLGTTIAVFATQLWLVLVGFALMGVGLALIMPIAFTKAASAPGPTGTAMASVATLGYGGMLLGPPAIGFLAQYFSFQIAFGLLAVLSLMVIVLAGKLGSEQN